MNVASLRLLIASVLFGGVLVGPALAQSGASVRVTATAEPMEVRADESVTFTVRVEGAPATMIQTPSRPPTTNLDPQQRTPSTRRDPSLGGGVAFTWQFRARSAGTARIQPVDVVVQETTYRTEEIRMRVTELPQRPSAPTLTRLEATGQDATTLDSRDLFIRATPSAGSAYQNEQVTVEYRLYYRPGIRLRHSHLADAWDAPSFWREELDVASRPVPRTRRAYGQTYETIVLKRVALFPTRPGTLHVDPLHIETDAQGSVPRQWGPSVRSRFETVRLTSRALTFRVRDLPASAPPSFDGAVGQFGMSVRAEADSGTVGEPVRVMVQLRGTGNLATLSPPRLEAPSAFEFYKPDVEMNIDRSGRRVGGTKTFTYTLVPRAGGHHDLPPVRFAYFDPETAQYEALRSDLPSLHVAGTAAPRAEGRTADGLPVGDITDLASASEAEWVRVDRSPLHRQVWVYVVLLLPLLGTLGVLLFRHRWQTSDTTTEPATPNAALKVAQKQLRTARQRVRNGSSQSATYDAVEQALSTFLHQRLDGNGVGAPRVALDRALTRKNVPEDLRNALYDLLDRCGEAQFAPDPSGQVSTKALIDEAESVVRRLDQSL